MIEIDHTAQGEASYSPKSAQPITADRLLEIEERQQARFCEKDDGLVRIKTGCLEIDDYVLCVSKDELNGGFERGVVVGLSAADGVESLGSRLISLNLIASVLIQHINLVNTIQKPQNKSRNTLKPKVVVIDTTGSFSLPLLVKVLKSRLLKRRQEMRSRNDTNGILENGHNPEANTETEIQEEVNVMLELVAISRVFDIEGLWGVLSEIGRTEERSNNDKDDQKISIKELLRKGKFLEKQAESLHKLPDEIGDSEDEDIDMTLPPIKFTTSNTNEVETSPEILIIDNMHYLISHLFTHSEKASAHNLLSLLSQTLHTLTHTQNILAILHNTTISTKMNYTKPGARPSPPPAIQSLFISTAQKPSLGRIFDDFLDLHVMISKIPKRREDAEVLYCQNQGENLRDGELEVDYCLVFEVLRDECPILGRDREMSRKFGDREGRWGLFEIGAGKTELGNAFVGVVVAGGGGERMVLE